MQVLCFYLRKCLRIAGTFQQSVQLVPTGAYQCILLASDMHLSHKLLVINPSIFTFRPSQNFVPMTKYRTAVLYQRSSRFAQLFNYSLNCNYRNSSPTSWHFMPSKGYFFMPQTQKPPIIATLFFLLCLFRDFAEMVHDCIPNHTRTPVKCVQNAFEP